MLGALLALTGTQASGRGDSPNDSRVREGLIVEGSYDPVGMQFGQSAMPTVQVIFCDQYAAATDDDSSELLSVRATLATTQIGDMAGPIGGERVLLYRTGSGWTALFEHGPDDTPKVPSGERWIAQRNRATGEVMGFIKLLQDGATAHDGLGGFSWTGAYAGIGGEFHALPDEAKAYAFAHAQELASNMISQTLQSLMTEFASALVTASLGASTPEQQAIALQLVIAAAGWVVGNVTPPDIPLGAPGCKIAV